MPAVAEIDEVGTVTSKGQATFPKPIRKVLNLSKGDLVNYHWDMSDPEAVVIRRHIPAQQSDPAMTAFLTFLARDMQRNPANVRPFTPEMAERIAELTEGMEFDRCAH